MWLGADATVPVAVAVCDPAGNLVAPPRIPWLGVDGNAQGLGLGSRLINGCLDFVDREHHPAYLDSTNPRNVPF